MTMILLIFQSRFSPVEPLREDDPGELANINYLDDYIELLYEEVASKIRGSSLILQVPGTFLTKINVFTFKLKDKNIYSLEEKFDEKINCFGGSQLSDGSRLCFNFKLGVEFSAVFKDVDGVTIGSQVLFEDGGNNPKREGNITTYRYRYILSIPDSVWSRWSEVSQVIITK